MLSGHSYGESIPWQLARRVLTQSRMVHPNKRNQ